MDRSPTAAKVLIGTHCCLLLIEDKECTNAMEEAARLIYAMFTSLHTILDDMLNIHIFCDAPML
jgi:hypothetical protein